MKKVPTFCCRINPLNHFNIHEVRIFILNRYLDKARGYIKSGLKVELLSLGPTILLPRAGVFLESHFK